MENNNADERLLRLKGVCERTGLSRSTIYLLVSQKSFPKPIAVGLRGRAWVTSEVSAWIQARIEQSRGPKTPAK